MAEACPTIILSLPSAKALADAVGGENGLAAASARGTVAIECSTLPLADKRAAFAVLDGAGKILLDCPLSGTGARAMGISSCLAAGMRRLSSAPGLSSRACRGSNDTSAPSATAAL